MSWLRLTSLPQSPPHPARSSTLGAFFQNVPPTVKAHHPASTCAANIVSMRFTVLLLLAETAFGQQNPGFDVTSLDRSVDPCVDFYKFSCGGWIAANPLPADQARYGRFDALQD